MNTITFQGYTARIEYSNEDQCFIGHIVGINDIVGFHGESIAELHAAFTEAVEDYLETCKKTRTPTPKALFRQAHVTRLS
jgi:predicted HicB family RNase H-like nuclease